MNPFFVGFLISFTLVFIIIIVLRLTVPYASKLFGTTPIPYKSFKESTDWLNFIVYRVLSHFQTPESINKINEIVTSKISPLKFELLTLGNSPSIPYVSTLNVRDKRDLKILIPIVWDDGPSANINIPGNIILEADLIHLKGTLLISWPPDTEIDLEFRFVGDVELDYDLVFHLWGKYRFSLTRLPILGPIILGIVPFVLSKRSLHTRINLELPEINNFN